MMGVGRWCAGAEQAKAKKDMPVPFLFCRAGPFADVDARRDSALVPLSCAGLGGSPRQRKPLHGNVTGPSSGGQTQCGRLGLPG